MFSTGRDQETVKCWKKESIPMQNTHDLLVGTLSIGIPSFKQCKFIICFTRFRLSRTSIVVFHWFSLYFHYMVRMLVNTCPSAGNEGNWFDNCELKDCYSVQDGFSLKEKRGNLPLESNGSIKLNLIIFDNASKEWESFWQIIQRGISALIFNWLKLKFWGFTVVTWKISIKDKVSSGLIRKRCQFTQGYVLLAMCSSRILTDNKLFHLTRVCFVLDCRWCFVQRKSKGVKG